MENLADTDSFGLNILFTPAARAIRYFATSELAKLKVAGPHPWHDRNALIPGEPADSEIYLEVLHNAGQFFASCPHAAKLVEASVIKFGPPPVLTPMGHMLALSGVKEGWFVNRKLLQCDGDLSHDQVESVELALKDHIDGANHLATHVVKVKGANFGRPLHPLNHEEMFREVNAPTASSIEEQMLRVMQADGVYTESELSAAREVLLRNAPNLRQLNKGLDAKTQAAVDFYRSTSILETGSWRITEFETPDGLTFAEAPGPAFVVETHLAAQRELGFACHFLGCEAISILVTDDERELHLWNSDGCLTHHVKSTGGRAVLKKSPGMVALSFMTPFYLFLMKTTRRGKNALQKFVCEWGSISIFY